MVQNANKKIYLLKNIELSGLCETNSRVLIVTLTVLSNIKNGCEQICSLQMNVKSWKDSQLKLSVVFTGAVIIHTTIIFFIFPLTMSGYFSIPTPGLARLIFSDIDFKSNLSRGS